MFEDTPDIPEDKPVEGDSCPIPSYSGRFSVRVPKDLHKALVEQSEEEGVSLNLYINLLLTQGVIVGMFTEALFRDAAEATVKDN